MDQLPEIIVAAATAAVDLPRAVAAVKEGADQAEQVAKDAYSESKEARALDKLQAAVEAASLALAAVQNKPNQSPQRNAGIGPATLDSAIPLRPALSSEETASTSARPTADMRPQSPRG